MKRCYLIHRLPDSVGQMPLTGEFHPETLTAPWNGLAEADIAAYPWDENGYRPPCKARVGWNRQGIHVLMYAREQRLRTQVHEHGGMVCTDSCMEFFLQPFPESTAVYLNAECTAYPAVLVGIGTNRHDRTVLSSLPEGFAPQASTHAGAWWAVSYTLSNAWLASVFGRAPAAGQIMRGNFYICGDETEYPHFGMWQGFDPLVIPRPDFHQPTLFGELTLAGGDAE